MSASKNPDSMTNAQGEFHSRRAPAEPLTTKGHAPGVKVGNDAAPEFNAEIYPPGTAESVAPGRTFHPNPVNEVPGQANNSVAQNRTKASDTLVGSTSADVHDGFGHPGAGMTSQEVHGGHGKKERSGLEGVGTSDSDPISKRGQDMDHEKYGRLAKPGRPEDWETAEDKVAMRAEDVASERD